MIYIESKRRKIQQIKKDYPRAVIIDVTSKGEAPWDRLSPFYPHGNIPVPFSGDVYMAACVEAVWQGLKVFEKDGEFEDISITTFSKCKKKDLKRTVRKHGTILGHRKGVNGDDNFLGYVEAKQEIYIRTYRWMLENYTMDLIEELRELNKTKTIVLLDYNTCEDDKDSNKPLSHAFLIKAYVEGIPPYDDLDVKSPQPVQLSFSFEE